MDGIAQRFAFGSAIGLSAGAQELRSMRNCESRNKARLRAPEFLPDSAAEQAEQKRELDFDAKEKKQEMERDKKLNICRCGEEHRQVCRRYEA
jgi:hypothetical protein